ncbi:MAG: leucyl aminopeptidase family protein [Phycisphaerales bacterium]|nr:MAG: leucyl aminopeptidase family protein [Phycisphaerales bacterium]
MFKSIRVSRASKPIVAAGIFSDDLKQKSSSGSTRKKRSEHVETARSRPGFRAEVGEVTIVDSQLVLFGLGSRSDVQHDALRTAGGKLIRALDRTAPKAISIQIEGALPDRISDRTLAGRALAEGIGLANWRVDFFDGSATQHEKPNAALTLDSDDSSFKSGLKDGLELADSANYARELACTPPNICNPTWMVTQARKLARETGLKCTVIDFKKAQQLGMGGIVNVGKASASKPCLIILEHKPQKIAAKAKKQKIAIVGKTITYDTGGYSLKISGGMKGMKNDKNGGMATIGAMRAIARRKVPVHVVGLLPCAENMVNGEAYRPDDIIEMYNKVTVEVTNTDAEGRLVLADALAYACDKLKPTAIFDTATLTGGVVVALGKWSAGVWSNDDPLFDRLQKASDATGEKIWRMPLWKEHKDFMRAKHADLWNSAPARDGHPIQGAAFLSFFVDDETPWAHIDIAGTSATDSDTDLHVSGPTGYGVRLLTEAVESWTR